MQFGLDYADQDVAIVAISSNDAVQYPDDGPDALGAMSRELGYNFPVLFDESQDVAKAYTAACTPDFFVFGPARTLAYRGRFDESPPQFGGHRHRTRLALRGRCHPWGWCGAGNQYPSMDAEIKWKPGNEPT